MKSRAELLAELDETSHKNNELGATPDGLQVLEPGAVGGYNPYDNPGVHKPSDINDTLRRRAILRRKRRR